MSGYDTILEIVAENPGIEMEELVSIAAGYSIDSSDVEHLLNKAVESGDVVEAADRYWIVRKGKYSFSKYNHPIPD